MYETWLQEKGWERVKRKLLKDFRWEVKVAGRRSKKGRAMREMVVGWRKELEGERAEINEEEEGLIMIRICLNGDCW